MRISNTEKGIFAWIDTRPMKRLILFSFLTVCLALAGQGSYAQDTEAHRHTFIHQGMERSYLYYEPDTLLAQRPLIIVLHGYGGKAERNPAFMTAAALEAGYAVCLPQGAADGRGKTCWNVGYDFQQGLETDDVDFICSLARHLAKEHRLNRSNIFVVGMSNGGEMCYLLAYKRPDFFAAFVPVAGLTMKWMKDVLVPRRPVSLMEVHGTADRTSLWDGDPDNVGGWGPYIAVPDAVQTWADAAGCTGELITPFNSIVTLHRYTGGRRGAEVLLYEVAGGIHDWSTNQMDTPSEILAFCSRHFRSRR